MYQKKLQRMLESEVHAEGAYTSSASLDEREYSSVDEDDEDDLAMAGQYRVWNEVWDDDF